MYACLMLALCARGQSTDYFISDNRKVNIDSFNDSIKAIMDSDGIPGLSVAIIENNKIVFTNSYGYKNNQKKIPVDPNTMFEACSLSKSFLVFAAYQFVDRGWLDLDKPMYQYLVNPRLEHDQRYKLITPRMILSHTSGLENWQGMNNPDVLEIIKDPGTEYTYSGEGFHYLADVMTHILNKSYSTYIQELVLSSLQLTATTLNYTEKDSLGDFALGHNVFGFPMDKWITPQPWPASSVNTDAADYAKLLIGMFGGNILSAKSRKTLLDTCKLLEHDDSSRYYVAHGFFELIRDKDTIINFSGNNYGFKADMLYSPGSKRGYVFFTNSDLGILPGPVINRLTTRFHAQLYYNEPYFALTGMKAAVVRKYREEGYTAMVKEVDRMAGPNLDYDGLEEVLFALYWNDKIAAENLAREILKYRPESGCANAILGLTIMDNHNDYTLAKTYLNKAKSLHWYGLDLGKYIKMCDDKLVKQ